MSDTSANPSERPESNAQADLFADIRPYHDDEVGPVLSRLLENSEFLDVLARFRLGAWAGFFPWLLRPLVRRHLHKEVRDVVDVHSMQMVIERYMDRMIKSTTDGFTVSGLEALSPDQPHLFISNHRDITMDPAFTNYALHTRGRDTVRIAIGDNLLTKPWVADLMRLNKSFIVKRSVSGGRELLAASKQLANYIQYSIVEDQVPVWIAQREGRAKDGLDRTEPVIIKMLSMSRNKRENSFAEHIRALRIVPVAISYELDPCDAMKANELHELSVHGVYEKSKHEDVASIAQGIAGDKGRVHVSFGTPLLGDFDTPEAVAAEIDRQVIGNFQLHYTNIYAYHHLHGDAAPLPQELPIGAGDCSIEKFTARIEALPQPQQPYALQIYANAVVSKLALAEGRLDAC